MQDFVRFFENEYLEVNLVMKIRKIDCISNDYCNLSI